jgi:hypothetical protein
MKYPAAFLIAAMTFAAAASLSGCAAQHSTMAANDGVRLEKCAEVIGSRIRSPERGDCAPIGYSYKSFSAEELDATGVVGLGDALRALDPAMR